MAKDSQLSIVWDQVGITLSTLAALTGILGASRIDAAREQGFRVMKTEYVGSIVGRTNGEGPVMLAVGFNLSLAEMEEAIEADPQSSFDTPANEQVMRPVFILGIFDPLAASPAILNNGIPKTVNFKWSAPEGGSMNWMAYNTSGSALTTGSVVRVVAKHFGVWLKD